MYELTGKPWSSTFCLYDLILRMPAFVTRYMEEKGKAEYKGKFYGQYNLGRTYDLAAWKRNKLFGMLTLWKHIDVHKVEDINDAERKLWIVVTESSWLLL